MGILRLRNICFLWLFDKTSPCGVGRSLRVSGNLREFMVKWVLVMYGELLRRANEGLGDECGYKLYLFHSCRK